MSLSRVAVGALRNFKPKAGGGGGGFFSQGTKEAEGILFGETPPPPGQSRKWEAWELPWYTMMGGAALILGFGLTSKPDTSFIRIARREAEKELKEEGVLP